MGFLRLIGRFLVATAAGGGLMAPCLPAAGQPDSYSAAEIRGWVVDAETKQPLEGVHVVAQWILETGILHGRHVTRLHILETMSDAKGEYYFPPWGPKPRPPFSMLDTADPRLTFFKPEYKPLTRSNAMPHHNPMRTSRWHGQTISLERFRGTPQEWVDALQSLQIRLAWGDLTDDLLHYFFRGRLDATIVGGRLEVVNRSDESLGAGTLALYSDDNTKTRRPVKTWEIMALAPGEQLRDSFTPPATAAGYMLVFRGALGNEADAVIGQVIEPDPYLFFEQQSVATLHLETDPSSFNFSGGGNTSTYAGYWPGSLRITGRLYKSLRVDVVGLSVWPARTSDVTYDKDSQTVTIHFSPERERGTSPFPHDAEPHGAALVITTTRPVLNPQGLDYPYPNKYALQQPSGPDDFFPVPGTGSQLATTIYFPLVFPCCYYAYTKSASAEVSSDPYEFAFNQYLLHGDFKLPWLQGIGIHRLRTGVSAQDYFDSSFPGGAEYSRAGAYLEWEFDSRYPPPPGDALAEPSTLVEHYYLYYEERGQERLKAVLPRSSFPVKLFP